jgi:glycosyltransferase involved in cell wall biosynthesis
MSVAVLLPTYCEAENIESLIREIQGLKLDLAIEVIDDSSPDGTGEIVKKLQKEFGNIHLFSRREKLGLGTAITTGFKSLMRLKNQPDYIITMDADYSHNPKDIPRLVHVAQCGYDLVIGSRYQKEGRVVGSPLRRRIISRIANLIAAAVVGVRVRDCTSGFRCYSKGYVKSAINELHSETYEIQIETIKQAKLHRFEIEEVPITFVNRKRGKSKLSMVELREFLVYVMKSFTRSNY